MKTSIILFLVLLVLGCLGQEGLGKGKVLILAEKELTIDVAIARTPEQREKGLMSRKSLGEMEGMLFIFPDAAPRSFWMKNTLIPLDIIYISQDTRIVKIVTAEPCQEDPCPMYDSLKPAMYVLEVNAGFAEKHGVKEGDLVGLSF